MKFKTARHKFGAVRCQRGELKFPSKLERSAFDRLEFLQKAGQVLFFLMQVPIRLDGGVKHLVDFLVFLPHHAVFLEIKGKDTPISKLKRKQAEERLGVEIKVAHSIQELDQALREG